MVVVVFLFLVIVCRVGEWIEMSTFMSIKELLLVFHLHIAPYSSYMQKEPGIIRGTFCVLFCFFFCLYVFLLPLLFLQYLSGVVSITTCID